MRAVAYCRVSTDETNQLNSLKNQKEHYEELFKKEKFEPVEVGLLYRKNGSEEIREPLRGIFADEGISGTKLKNREAFRYMMECAKRKEFNIIYVKNVARWARSVGDGDKTLKDLKQYGIKVVFEDGNLNSFDHELVINMFFSVAQEESRNKSIAVQFGIRKAQKQGKWNCQVPFGYDIMNGYLQINKKEAETVKLIYDKYLKEGWGTSKICRHLNDVEITTKNDKQWCQTQVCYILDNSLYVGKQTNHTIQNIDVNRNILKQIDKSEWNVIQKEELRIISDEDWKYVQLERSRRKSMVNYATRHSSTHILSNLIYCGNCGGNHKRKKRNSRDKFGNKKSIGYEWTCQINDMYGKKKCDTRNAIKEEDLIEKIIDLIKLEKEIMTDEYMDNLIKKDICRLYDETNYEKNLILLQEEIDDIKLNSKNLLSLYSKQIIDDEEFKDRNVHLKEELYKKETELRKLQSRDLEIERLKVLHYERRKYINEMDIDNLSNAILKHTFSRIIVGKDKKGFVDILKWSYNLPN